MTCVYQNPATLNHLRNPVQSHTSNSLPQPITALNMIISNHLAFPQLPSAKYLFPRFLAAIAFGSSGKLCI